MCYRADWVLPVSGPPVRDGWIVIDAGIVQDTGRGGPSSAVDLGRVAVLPSLVNAHTHLELSYLRGQVPASTRLVDWVRRLLALRRGSGGTDPDRQRAGVVAAIREARDSGCGLLGDVTNSLVTIGPLRESGVPARVFYELIGFGAGQGEARVLAARAELDADGSADESVRTSLAAHAPYSVSPELLAAIRRDLDARQGRVTSVHLGESPEEVEFVAEGTGPWKDVLVELGAWNDRWTPHGGSPVDYLDALGFLDPRVLVVHGVQFSEADLRRVRQAGATLVSCPRSNRHVGVGAPPLASAYAMQVSVAFGTDSLASAPDMNLFAELLEARRLAPGVPPRALLESATLTGATALGFGDEFGSIEPGKRASLIAVQIPDGVDDVEEYLTSGVSPGQVMWLDESGG